MAFDKQELKQLKFLFHESEDKIIGKTTEKTQQLILQNEGRIIDKTEKLIKESEKRTEKKTREIVKSETTKIVQSETRKIVHSETKLVICEALEELVLPRLQAVEDKQEEHSVILQDHSDSLERIEGIQRAEAKRNDTQDEKLEIHEQRLVKVEKVLVGR